AQRERGGGGISGSAPTDAASGPAAGQKSTSRLESRPEECSGGNSARKRSCSKDLLAPQCAESARCITACWAAAYRGRAASDNPMATTKAPVHELATGDQLLFKAHRGSGFRSGAFARVGVNSD